MVWVVVLMLSIVTGWNFYALAIVHDIHKQNEKQIWDYLEAKKAVFEEWTKPTVR